MSERTTGRCDTTVAGFTDRACSTADVLDRCVAGVDRAVPGAAQIISFSAS